MLHFIHPDKSKTQALQTVRIHPLVSELGPGADQTFFDFFFSTISNENTRQAYKRALFQFFTWCEEHDLTLQIVKPFHVGIYRDQIAERLSKASVKQHLAALRKFYDFLTERHLIEVNPTGSVRGPRHNPKIGKTPILNSKDIRRIFTRIDISNIVGLRDRALMAAMLFTFGRVSAVVDLKLGDLFQANHKWNLRLREKGGVELTIPVHHLLQEYLFDYIEHPDFGDRTPDTPIFRRSVRGRNPQELQKTPMSRIDAFRVVKRRASQAGIHSPVCDHTFRASGITLYLENGGSIFEAQKIAGHAYPRTTQLYDRTSREVKLAEIERIRL